LAPELVAAWGHGRSGHFGGNPMPGLWMMGGALSLLERAPDDVLAIDLAACHAYGGAAAAATRVNCPTLFVLGATDRMTPPAKAAPLADAIRSSRRAILPDTGHMLMSERPDTVIDALATII
jgi:pimeloyl-ACP methyl ester carboxylesterase